MLYGNYGHSEKIKKRKEISLAFGELEASARPAAAVFFPFNHARIAGKVSVAPKACIIGLINFDQSAGKTVAAGSCLTIVSASVHVYQNIKLVFAVCYH
jgi:hypothetical protein